MALLIDTAAVPAPERLDFWLASSSDAYHPLQIRSADKEEFWGRMWGRELGPLGLFRIVAAPNTMIRTSRAIAAHDSESLHVHVVLQGAVNAAQEGRTTVARAGDVFTYETSSPVLLCADRPFESLVIRVPRSVLGAEASRIADLTAVRISGRERLPRAAAAALRRLANDVETGAIAVDDVPRAVDRALELVRSLYSPRATSGPIRLRTRAEILLCVESYIDANLGNPDLAPEEIARASFVSTRYLHKLFQTEGTSVSRWIRTSRLERCRRDLLDPALRHETILSIASRWGLPGPQHFSRIFRAEYGISAREARRLALAS